MKSPPTAETDNILANFRSGIDALDDQIISLLKQRSDIVAQVGEYKRLHASHLHNIRPGREAQMVRRIVEKFKNGKFSPAPAAAMWRIIISASTAIETEIRLSVFMPENDATYLMLAQEYFGTFLPIAYHPVINRVLDDVMDKKSSVGIVPMPQAQDIEPWWLALAESRERMLRIFAHIPFIMPVKGRQLTALAIGLVEPEPTGDDISYLLLSTNESISTSRLQESMQKHGLDAHWVHVNTGQPRYHLVTVTGFVTQEDERLKKLLSDSGDSVVRITFLGAYAAPITLEALPSCP